MNFFFGRRGWKKYNMFFPFVSIFTAAIVTRWMFVAIRDMHRNQELNCGWTNTWNDRIATEGFENKISIDSLQQRHLRGHRLDNNLLIDSKQQHYLRGFVERISV